MSNTSYSSHKISSICNFRHNPSNSDGVSFEVKYQNGDTSNFYFWGLSYEDAKDFTDRNNDTRETTLESAQASEITHLSGNLLETQAALSEALESLYNIRKTLRGFYSC